MSNSESDTDEGTAEQTDEQMGFTVMLSDYPQLFDKRKTPNIMKQKEKCWEDLTKTFNTNYNKNATVKQGLIDKHGYTKIDDLAQEAKEALDKGLYVEASELEVKITNTVVELTKGIDIYNIAIKFNSTTSPKLMSYEKKCNKFMNAVVKRKLNIPKELTWAYTNRDVYNALEGDIMRSVTTRIEHLLNNTDVKVIVYNGIFDFIVNTPGTLSWLDKLNWIGAPLWHNTSQEALEINMINEGYVRRAGNLIFYIILRAGHSVPVDNAIAMEEILKLELL